MSSPIDRLEAALIEYDEDGQLFGTSGAGAYFLAKHLAGRELETVARIEYLERRLEQALADKARETARANQLADRLKVVKALADEWAQTWARWHEHDRTGRFGVFRVHANRLRRAAAGGGA